MEGGGLFSLRTKSLSGSKRIKISRACDECRKRKVKCDGVQPCGRCRKSNGECVFAKLPPKRGPPKQYMENLENRLQRVEKALKSMANPIRKMFDEQHQTEYQEQTSMAIDVSNTVSYSAPFTADMSLSNIDRFTINEIGQAVYVNDLKERFDRIPNIQQQQRQQLQQQEHSNDALSEIASISDQSVTTTSIELPVPDHLSSRNLIQELQPLTEVYFDHVHKYIPMIHKPSFLKQMHSSTNPPSRLLLYAMCAVASKWSPDHIGAVNNTMPLGYTYYQRALDLLDDFIDSPRIATVQALLLLVKYQEYCQQSGYFHRSYTYLRMATQMCCDLGLNQLEGDSYDIEAKRRTFWAAFMYDLLISIEQGHATYFDVHKCTTGFPLVTGEEGPALEELITNQNIFIQLGKVLSDIYAMTRRIYARQQVQGDARTDDQVIEEQTRLFSLHTHLENFLYEVPPSLIYPPTQDVENYPVEKQSISDPFIGFLHMTYHFSVILLHRIYSTYPPPEIDHKFVAYPHRKLCAISASNITNIADVLVDTYPKHIFSYPTRGVQHTIHCLAMASTIHKYEMAHAKDETMRKSARSQYMLSVDIIQKLSSQSPSTEFSKYYNHQATMAVPIHHHYHQPQPQPQPQPQLQVQQQTTHVQAQTQIQAQVQAQNQAQAQTRPRTQTQGEPQTQTQLQQQKSQQAQQLQMQTQSQIQTQPQSQVQAKPQPQPQSQQAQQADMYIQPSDKSKIRRNTLSSVPVSINESAALYQSSASITDPSQLTSLMAQQDYTNSHHLKYNYKQQQPSKPHPWQPSEDIQLQKHSPQPYQQHLSVTSWNQPSHQSCSSQHSSPRQPQTQLNPSPQLQAQHSSYYTNNNKSTINTGIYSNSQADIILPSNQSPSYLSVVAPSNGDIIVPSSTDNGGNSRIRRHTFSNSPHQQQGSYYYPNVTEPIMMMQNKMTIPADKQSNYNTMISPIAAGMGMMMEQSREEDAIMMNHNTTVAVTATAAAANSTINITPPPPPPSNVESYQPHHHPYDPTSGMSQLYLTDDQQQQQRQDQQQQISWEESLISDSGGVQRSEGHVMT